jgi:hypothetical protein
LPDIKESILDLRHLNLGTETVPSSPESFGFLAFNKTSMKPLLLLVFTVSVMSQLLAQNPAIYTEEKITAISPGSYETALCEGGIKKLWTDSTAGYTSFLWSNGDITPSISIATPLSINDTITLTVGLQMGGTASTIIYLQRSMLLWAHKMMVPASSPACPGPLEFSVEPHLLDSVISFSNGINFTPSLSVNCNKVAYNVSAPPYPSGTRYLTNGCIVPVQAANYTLFDSNLVPTVTLSGNTFTATHPLYFGPPNQVFDWFDMGGTLVGQGENYNATTAGSFYAQMSFRAFNTLYNHPSLGCDAAGAIFCYTNYSDTLTYPMVGLDEPNPTRATAYPNPTNGTFELSMVPRDESVAVFNMQGMDFGLLKSQTGRFDAQHLPSGLFWLVWLDQNGQRQSCPLHLAPH